MKAYLGIDPGISGARALIDEDGNLIEIIDNADRFNRMDGYTLALVALEAVHSMPKQGVASSFKFGAEFGWWLGWLAALSIPYIEVTPTKWQKAVLDIRPAKGTAKEAVWQFCRRRWPTAEISTARGKRLYGRSDALGLAYYAYLQEGRK